MNKSTKKVVVRPVSTFEIAFAKLMFCHLPSSSSSRIALYNKLRSLLKNRFSLMDALEITTASPKSAPTLVPPI